MGAFDPLITYEKGTFIGKYLPISLNTKRTRAVRPPPSSQADEIDKVSRKAVINGATNIVLGGKSIIQSGAILRGDLRRSTAGQHVVISMGRYCSIGQDSIIRPPGKIYKGQFTYYPVRISDFVHVGEKCIIEAAQIGSGVEIGDNSIIGEFVIVKDLAVILPDTVLPEGTVVPSFSVWSGNPGKLVDTLPETYQETTEARCRGFYQRFKAA